jgi:predicted peptidase
VPDPATAGRSHDDSNRNVVLPTEPGDHKLKFRTHIGDKPVQMSYLLHLPPTYGDGKKYPMLVFFHGIGECGTDLAGVYALGPMTLLREDGGNPTFSASCPFIVLCPQCPPQGQTWDTDYMIKACAELVAQTIKKTRTDPDRVYATGLSMGGLGSWCVVEQAPELFAAVAPLSAMAWHPESALQQLKYVSIWCVVGVGDQPRFVDGTRSMEAALSKGPLQQRFTYMVGMGHDAWYPPYQNPQFYEWLLEHHRPDAELRKKLDAQTSPPTTQPIPSAPGHYVLSYRTKIGDQPIDLDYVLYIPRGYKPNTPPHPAIVFLHEQDTIGPEYKGICLHGPDLTLEKHPALQNNFPFVIISPRLPIKCDWQTPGMTQTLLGLIDHVSQSIAIDPQRISVTGINAGADGAWKLASEAPDRFSALVPVVTDGPFTPGDDRTQITTTLPGRAFIKASNDGSVDRMNQIISNTKLDWKLQKVGENTSATGDVPAYNDRQFLNWLAEQHHTATPVSTARK